MKIPNEDKSLNKRRHAMPQISDFDAFVADLDDSGHAIVTLKVDPNELIPTQGNFNEEKVKGMVREGTWNAKPIISSDDDYVLDGHHRWLSAVMAGKDIQTRVVDMNIEDLLAFVKDKPYVKTKSINEDMSTQLRQVQDYYSRVAKGEGGHQYAQTLNRVVQLRQLLEANKDATIKKRAQIVRFIEQIEELVR